jgi:hypothetical protein
MTDVEFAWQNGTVKRKTLGSETITLPAQRGLSHDGFTAVELVGKRGTIVSATVVGLLSPTNEDVTRRNAAYAAGLLQRLIPEWAGGGSWLAQQIVQLRKKPRIETTAHGWAIRLTFLSETNQLTFHLTR